MATTKSAPKKANSKEEKKEPGDSPINIGSGGGRRSKNRTDPPFVEIDFDYNDYTEDGDVWTNPDLELAYLLVNGREVPNVTSRSRIEIDYRRGDPFENTIRTIPINEDAKMGVRFFGHFAYDRRTKKYSARALIIALRVGLDSVGLRTPIDLPNGEVKIEFHTRYKQTLTRKKKR